MRTVDNALSDVAAMYKEGVISFDITYPTGESKIWLVNVYNNHAPDSRLKIEIIDSNGVPVCCVLEKVNVGRRSMVRFMDRLVDALD